MVQVKKDKNLGGGLEKKKKARTDEGDVLLAILS